MNEWGADDVDLVGVYDSCAAVTCIALEGLGISAKRDAAREFAKKRFSQDGDLRLNTRWGLLSAGLTGGGGGTALLVKGIRQLLHRIEPRAKWRTPASASCGTGGSYMDADHDAGG